MADEFYSQVNYQLPEDMPEQVEGEQFKYYQHPEGYYKGFVGKLSMRYKDMEGKRCEASKPGAQPSHGIMNIWILQFLGKDNAQNDIQYIRHTESGLALPKFDEAVTPYHVYFPLRVEVEKKSQWKNFQLFEDWSIPGQDQLRLVTTNPSKPSSKIFIFKNLPYYYGAICNFHVVHSDKGNAYIETIELPKDFNRFDPKEIQSMERGFDKEMTKVQEQRDADKQTDSAPNAAPPSEEDFNDLRGDESANEFKGL